MEVLKCWKTVEFPKISIKMKNCKTLYKAQIVSHLRKLFSLPLPHPQPCKILLQLWNKHFLVEIYRNIQAFAFKVFQECSSWLSRNGAVQMFFLTPNRNIFTAKFVKSERFLTVLWEHITFDVKWVEVHKMSEVFWVKLYCKISDLFSSFCWLWDFLLENLKLKKKLWWCPLERVDKYYKVVCPK